MTESADDPPTEPPFPPVPPPPPVVAPPVRSTVDASAWVYLGSAAFVLVAVLAVGLGLVVVTSFPGRLPFTSAGGERSSSAGPYDSETPYGSGSATPEASDPSSDSSYRDPASLDQASTDTTPFTEDQIFPEETVTADDGTVYTLAADGFFSACTDSGGSDTETLMRAHGCGNMLTADYTDDAGGMFLSTMVVPLPSTDDAAAVRADFNKDDSPAFNELTVYCPRDVAYDQTICHGSADPAWHATFTNYHRYLIVAMSVMQNGSDTPDTQHVHNAGAAVIDEVETALGD